MKNLIYAAALGAGTLNLAALTALPAAASTTSAPPQRYFFQTRIVNSIEAGEYDGTLRLTVYPSGIVAGTYQPSDGPYRTVTGGLTGSSIWLDIGASERMRLIGSFKNGVLDATVQEPGPNIQTFESVPATNP